MNGRRPLVLLLLALSSVARAQSPDLKAVLVEEKSVLDALDRAVFEARRADLAMKSAEAARAGTEERLRTAQAGLRTAQKARDEAGARLQATLRLVAAARPYGTAASLLLGPEGDDLVRRRALTDRLAARQAGELATMLKAADLAAVAELRAGIERANVYATTAAEKEARERLDTETKARRTLLAALEHDRALALRRATELGASVRSMVADVEGRLSRRPALVPFDRLVGKVRLPMAGAKVAVPFGDVVHPVFKTATPHPGLTLEFAGEVRNVRAVAFGRVVFVGHMRGFGTTVVVDHASGYYTVYAGFSSVAVAMDAIVRDGDLLGRVDRDPGDDAVRLYFEIRHGAEALDPAPFLAKGQP